MRRNPAPPYPNANLSATENRRRLKRWVALGERWLKKAKALLTPSELEYSTVRNTLELAEWAPSGYRIKLRRGRRLLHVVIR